MRVLAVRLISVVLVSLVSFEIMSIGAVRFGLVPANAPSYVWPSFQPFWAPINRHFGMWHPPHAHFNHAKACYNLVYRTNAHGARDRERDFQSEGTRAVVVGDSFMEGYGLDRAQRLSDRLEAASGVPHLNFATSGGFGPTQYLLLYENLVKRFSHDAVVIGILADNDFTDDDPAFAETRGGAVYAPYFHADADGGYALRYANPDGLGTPERTRRQAWKHGLRSLLRSFSYGVNVIDYLKASFTYQRALDRHRIGNAKGYSGYFDYSPEQWARMAHVLNAFFSAAGGRPVTIVLIPRPNDLARAATAHDTPLARDMRRLVDGRANVKVIDLLGEFAKVRDPAELYNRCDGHWSPAGAALAAEVLMARGIVKALQNP